MATPQDDLSLYEGLMTTRAMRRFTDEPVSDDQLWACLRAAVQAPSGGNIQPYRFVVVRDPGRRSRIAGWYRAAHDRYEPAVRAANPPPDDPEARASWERSWAASRRLAATIGEAPVHVLVVAPRITMTVRDADGEMDVGPLSASVYPAVWSLLLAARAVGLGGVLTTVARIHEAEVLAEVGVPADRWWLAALVPLGHPAGRWGPGRRRPAAAVTSWETFGARRPDPGEGPLRPPEAPAT